MDAAYTGRQIAERRKALGLTQKELAEKLHVTDKAVSKWERGINFPDLGLMEALAATLKTTPAHLLGLEDADRDAVVSSLTEISNEQLETARKDIRCFGWSSLLVAAALVLVYQCIPRQTVRAYQLLMVLIVIILAAGRYTLVKYEDIKKLEPEDLLIFLGGFFPAFLYLFIQFFTGYSPQPAFGALLIGITSVCTQIFFWRVIRPYTAKLLPILLSTGFALWHSLDGAIPFIFLLPALCTGVVAAVYLWKDRRNIRIVPKRLLIALCVIILIAFVLCFVFYTELVQSYVTIRHEQLESYAQELLSEQQQDTYGFWNVASYPDVGMVEFRTGGSGLAPEASTKDFTTPPGMSIFPTRGLALNWKSTEIPPIGTIPQKTPTTGAPPSGYFQTGFGMRPTTKISVTFLSLNKKVTKVISQRELFTKTLLWESPPKPKEMLFL